jgi:hypothetical protein
LERQGVGTQIAVEKRHSRLVYELLDTDIDINDTPAILGYPLILQAATICYRLGFMQVLIELGADVNRRGNVLSWVAIVH